MSEIRQKLEHLCQVSVAMVIARGGRTTGQVEKFVAFQNDQ